jgi:hypothetical protein
VSRQRSVLIDLSATRRNISLIPEEDFVIRFFCFLALGCFSIFAFADDLDLYKGTYGVVSHTCPKKEETSEYCELTQVKIDVVEEKNGARSLTFLFVTPKRPIALDAATRNECPDDDKDKPVENDKIVCRISQLYSTDKGVRFTSMVRQEHQSMMKNILFTPIGNRFRLSISHHTAFYEVGLLDETWSFVLQKNQ